MSSDDDAELFAKAAGLSLVSKNFVVGVTVSLTGLSTLNKKSALVTRAF